MWSCGLFRWKMKTLIFGSIRSSRSGNLRLSVLGISCLEHSSSSYGLRSVRRSLKYFVLFDNLMYDFSLSVTACLRAEPPLCWTPGTKHSSRRRSLSSWRFSSSSGTGSSSTRIAWRRSRLRLRNSEPLKINKLALFLCLYVCGAEWIRVVWTW